MIGFLRGKARDIHPKEILILTDSGVGYSVHPAGTLLAKAKKGEIIEAEIATIVRENEISLYGFGSGDEKKLFEKLLSVSGIGPKTALQMIAVPVGKFMDAVAQGDVAFLTRLPGLGKKTAERLIIELRGKLDLQADAQAPADISFEEAREALLHLGYDSHEIQKVLSKAEKESNAEELIRYFLSMRK